MVKENYSLLSITKSNRKIAILGATGRTSRQVVKTLLSQQDHSLHLHLLARSRARLDTIIPNVGLHPAVEITEGSLSDKEAIKDYLRNASSIICTIGSNDNVPGLRAFQDNALAMTAALSDLQAESGSSWQRPHLTLLTSVSTNPKFIDQRPWLLEWLVSGAFNHVYNDLRAGEQIFFCFPSLMMFNFVHAPLILEEERTGCRVDADIEGTCISYQDLGEVMAKLAMDLEATEIGNLGVESVGPVVKSAEFWKACLSNLACGYFNRLLPGYWSI